MKSQWITETALLTALITVTGAVKVPGLILGAEFQLSAPMAVAICTAFGFNKYMIAGILSSVIGLLLGTQNILHVLIAMIFRLTVGGLIGVCGTAWPIVTLAGPAGSAVARLALAGFIGKAAVPLLLAAVPGMIYTAIAAWPLTRLLVRIQRQKERLAQHAVQR